MRTEAFEVTLRFTSDLTFFLPRRHRGGVVTVTLREKTSVKDVIESCGVPHTEVQRIVDGGCTVAFEHHVLADATLEVQGVLSTPSHEEGLQARTATRFVADGHLGKLTRDLRLLGFDVVYSARASDEVLAQIASGEDRALLTRDRRLLMHKVVRHGYCVRSTTPDEQVMEVLQRFCLKDEIEPCTRCIRCNGALERVAKADVLEQLEPLTRVYYKDFRRCLDCGKIYWSGSHFSRLQARVEEIRSRLQTAELQVSPGESSA